MRKIAIVLHLRNLALREYEPRQKKRACSGFVGSAGFELTTSQAIDLFRGVQSCVSSSSSFSVPWARALLRSDTRFTWAAFKMASMSCLSIAALSG
jgi:hypothetical protein